MHVLPKKIGRAAALLALVVAWLGIVAAPAQAATLTGRACLSPPIVTGDGLRKLEVCVRGWRSDDLTVTRGVVETHSYVSIGGSWRDSVSQTITLHDAYVTGNDPVSFGADHGSDTCRIDGPAGRVGCSVPNTARVAFYSALLHTHPTVANVWDTTVKRVAWRDDLGKAHYATIDLRSPTWSA